jgi:hypothetical protein
MKNGYERNTIRSSYHILQIQMKIWNEKSDHICSIISFAIFQFSSVRILA